MDIEKKNNKSKMKKEDIDHDVLMADALIKIKAIEKILIRNIENY